MDSPFPITLDSAGNLYLGDGVYPGDLTDNRVREISGVASPLTPNIVSVVSGGFQPGVVPNSWVAIFGTNLSAVTDFWTVTNSQFPTELDGVSVSIGGQPAYTEFVSAGQINVLAPNIGAGPVQVTVTNALGTSAAFSAVSAIDGPAFLPMGLSIRRRHLHRLHLCCEEWRHPGLYYGRGQPGRRLDLVGHRLRTHHSRRAARRGGPIHRELLDGRSVTLTIGGIPATVYGAVLSPGFAGLYQVAIQVPMVASGDRTHRRQGQRSGLIICNADHHPVVTYSLPVARASAGATRMG